MIRLTIFIAILSIAFLWLKRLNKKYSIISLCRRFTTVDGTPLEKCVGIDYGKTIFGTTFDIISLSSEEFFNYSRDITKQLQRSYVNYVIGRAMYNIVDAADAELVFNDPTLITKGFFYDYMQPFLKTGLLTSTDKKWHSRRKLLTPAFHFNILTEFEEIFKQESEKFVKIILKRVQEENDTVIALNDLIPRFTLNNVCETALGVQLDECLDGDEYRKHIDKIDESLTKRARNPLLKNDFLNNLFGSGIKDKKTIHKLHTFSSGIIQKRRIAFNNELKKQELQNCNNYNNDVDDTGLVYKKKRRYAMLDTLLHAEKDGLIDHAGICEEVDTFMFEGFDTTSMNLMFTLMNLSLFPEMQQRCYEEINEYINDDLTELNVADLNKLKYLEFFIKETLRLYPSVPIIIRKCTKETPLANNLLLPKGAEIVVNIFDIHRNPKYFDNPDEFRPERFLPENSTNRHPFAYVPFSAGQRNCIGQKFVMLEIKTLLVYILKNFKLLPMTDPKNVHFLSGILIRTQTIIKVKMMLR